MDVNTININNPVSQVGYSSAADGSNQGRDTGSDNPDVQKDAKIDKNELNRAVDFSNKVLFKNNTHLKFKVHEVTKDIMVKIVDDQTGDVIKEIPPEKILDMVAKLWEIAGIIVDERR